MKKKVLFVGIQNNGCSQMAEAFLNQLHGDVFEAYSAGLEPGKPNPIAAEAMQEEGIDISGNKPKWIFDVIASGRNFTYVITVCDTANAKRCPNIPGVTTRLQWDLPNLSRFDGPHDYLLDNMRELRNAVKQKITQWCGEVWGLKFKRGPQKTEA